MPLKSLLGRLASQLQDGSLSIEDAVDQVEQLLEGSSTWTLVQAAARFYAFASACDKDREEEFAEKAIDLLACLAATNPVNLGFILPDPAFDNLNGHDDFAEVVAAFEKIAAID